MKASYNWLKEFVDFDHSPEELADLLTRIGLNVEAIDEVGLTCKDVVVGRVFTCKPMPDSDHLSYCEVDAGTGETLGIVCGAPNIAAGQVVPVALVGAEFSGGFKITKRKLRGVVSTGMICSEKELGLGEDHEGIMVLEQPPPQSGGGEDLDSTPIEGNPPLIPPYSSRGGEGESSFQIGTPLSDYMGKQDWIFDIEVTINRPDCLSHLGIAREISAKTGLELRMPEINLEETDELAENRLTIRIDAPDKCPRYSARIVNDVKIAPSPLYMQDRLRALGVRPISNVVDVTNYVMLELGHPLHAFDYHLIADQTIVVRTATKGEKFSTLDDKVHKLEETDLLIADPEKGIALGGVMGGLNSEIKEDTKDVLLECAYFEPVGIRVTSRDRGICSESSYRFERGADPEMTPFAVSRAAFLIQKFAAGQVLEGIVDEYSKPWQSKTLQFRVERVNQLLATDISSDDMVIFLKRLCCDVFENDQITVKPPSWRHDLEREIDLVEEIARLHGYDNIDSATRSRVPLAYNSASEQKRLFTGRIKQALVEVDFREAINPPLVPFSDSERFPTHATPVAITNPLSEDMSHLRTCLAPSLMRSAARSMSLGVPDIRLFEWGSCFRIEEGNIIEEVRLAGLIMGKNRPESWIDTSRELTIYDLKGLIEQFARKISLDKPQFNPYDINGLSDGCKILFMRDDRKVEIGWCGRLLTEICDQFNLDHAAWYFELDGDKLLKFAGNIPSYKPLPRFPVALRDLAFQVSENVMTGEVEQILKRIGGEQLVDAELFDLFSGKGIPAEKKSLAFHLTFRSSQRTLSDSEVNDSIDLMIKAVERELGAVLRS